jgi:hypothetical protein
MRKLLLPAAAAAALLAIAPMTAASAASHDVLTISKVGGPNVKVGAILQSGLKFGKTAVFAAGSVKVTCKRVMFKDQVTKNPSRPGTAVEKLKSQTFSACSISGINGTKGPPTFKLNNLPYKTTVTSKGLVTVYKSSTTISVGVLGGTLKCTYVAKTTKGTASNKSETITFTGQTFIKTSGPNSTCTHTAKFSATFGPVVDASVKGHPRVFVN